MDDFITDVGKMIAEIHRLVSVADSHPEWLGALDVATFYEFQAIAHDVAIYS